MFTTKNFFSLIGKHLFVAIGTILIAMLLVFFLSKQIAQVSKDVIKNRALASSLSERTALLSNLKKEAGLIGTNDTTIKQAFIPSNNILSFIAILKSIALKNGVAQVYSFSNPSVATSGATFSTATISYQNTVTANLNIFINYLKDFEKLPYFTKINSVTIASSQGNWLNGATVIFGATVSAEAIQ